MSIKWGPLFEVFAVSLGSTVAVVVLLTVALLDLSARATAARAGSTDRRTHLSPTAGTAVAAACLAGAAAVVLFGLWVLVVR